MSFALKELSRLLAPEQTVVGAVVGIDGSVVRVATERGAVTARTLDAVAVGDRVKRGQLLFEDRKTEGVRFTAPGAGTISAINRGARRALQSVVIELTPSERQGRAADSDHQRFANYTARAVRRLDGKAARELLVESGLWTAIRLSMAGSTSTARGCCRC